MYFCTQFSENELRFGGNENEKGIIRFVGSGFDDDHFVGRPVCRFDSQFSKNELQRGPFYVMDFFSMYEVCVIHPLRQAFGRPVLFQIVIR